MIYPQVYSPTLIHTGKHCGAQEDSLCKEFLHIGHVCGDVDTCSIVQGSAYVGDSCVVCMQPLHDIRITKDRIRH